LKNSILLENEGNFVDKVNFKSDEQSSDRLIPALKEERGGRKGSEGNNHHKREKFSNMMEYPKKFNVEPKYIGLLMMLKGKPEIFAGRRIPK